MTASYFGNVNVDLLNWLPINAQRVLELGCGEGALAAAYRHRNPNVDYAAVEIHAPSAEVARHRVDRLYQGDFERMNDQDFAQAGPFDLVFMGDVLEHLGDPWRTLQRISNLMTETGTFVCCVPNIAHWSALADLFHGRWEYKDSGLFDRTHLRFFTLDSLTTMFRETGFRVLKVRPRRILGNRVEAERAIPIFADAAARLGIDRQSFIQRASALQYIIVAENAGSKPKPAVTHLHVAALAPRFLDVRARLPAQFLDAEPHLAVSFAEKTLTLPSLPANAPKICILQRMAMPEPAAWMTWVRKRILENWLLVAEVDDHPGLMAAVHSRDIDEKAWLPFSSVHAVQTSTPTLAEAFRQYNGEVAVFPNCVFNLPPFEEKKEPLRVFYGALNRELFSAQVAKALTPFIQSHPDVTFVVVHDRAFFDALETPAKLFYPALPYEDYLKRMEECHVALMPLEGTFGETFKSDIKFLEASSQSLATIASRPVYEQTIHEGSTGLLATSLEDWPRQLARLCEDRELRLTLARNAWNYTREARMFANQVDARETWYHSLWDQREGLTADLIRRHPELSNAADTIS